VLEDGAWWWNVRLIPGRALGFTWPEGTTSSAAAIGGPRPACWPCVRGWLGVSPACWSSPAEQAGWLLGYSMSPPALGVALALGARRWHPRGDGHGPGQASRSGAKQSGCGVLLFGEPLAPLQGGTLARRRWRKAPAEWPTSRVATHLLGTPFLPPLGGWAVLILEDVGEAPLPDRGACSPLALCGALQTAGLVWLRQFL